jgi:glycosyltransferase involved in cell wall biosynthesis
MLTAHRTLGTWSKAVDVYIALTEFGRRKLVEGGLPADKIEIKPNCAYPDPGAGMGKGGYAVFVGRLSAEKGLDTLLKAWRHLGGDVPLKLLGDGPMATAVQDAAAKDSSIQWLGHVSLEAVYGLVGEAMFLVLPSRCYENFSMAIVEAFAKGTPVVVSKLGGMAAIVEDGCTGLHFRPGDPADLAAKVRQILADPLELARMRRAARLTFDEKFTADSSYKSLMAIYRRALGGHANF